MSKEVLDGRRRTSISEVWKISEVTKNAETLSKVKPGETVAFSYLENHEPGHNKFYKIWIEKSAGGYTVMRRWGRCGTYGQQQILQETSSYPAAESWARLQTDKKLGRGYQMTEEPR